MKKIIFILIALAAVLSAQAQKDSDAPKTDSVVETSEPEVLIYVEEMPEFPGGQDAMYRFISKHLVYPQDAIENEIEGKVFVEFVVKQDGTISHATIKKSLGHGCDEEVLRVLKQMPKWKPGKQNGKPVAVKFTLPVVFKLN